MLERSLPHRTAPSRLCFHDGGYGAHSVCCGDTWAQASQPPQNLEIFEWRMRNVVVVHSDWRFRRRRDLLLSATVSIANAGAAVRSALARSIPLNMRPFREIIGNLRAQPQAAGRFTTSFARIVDRRSIGRPTSYQGSSALLSARWRTRNTRLPLDPSSNNRNITGFRLTVSLSTFNEVAQQKKQSETRPWATIAHRPPD
jgi:hypothetical protein